MSVRYADKAIWITSEPIEQPLREFLPNQPNLESAIQSWLEEIGS